MTFTKTQIKKMVRGGAAGIVECQDLNALLGTENHNQICDDHELMAYAEEEQRRVAERIRKG